MPGVTGEWRNDGRLSLFALAFAVLCFIAPSVNGVDWDVITELDDYVNRENPLYAWDVIESYDYPEYTLAILNLTSHEWMDETFSNNSIWWHYLSVFIPKNLLIRDAGYIFIGGGSTNDPPPSPDSDRMQRTAKFAVQTGAVSAYLGMVPFQPIYFVDSSSEKTEDQIIAYTWNIYITDPDEPNPDVVAFLPMTMAAKTALDAVTEFTSGQDPTIQLVKFMPTGLSKRGWTTWLLGCVDRRVFAMAPVVLDLLNIVTNLEHHYRAFGGWSWGFLPYWAEDVTRYLYHPRTEEMEMFIDPMSFKERLTMPKLVITASGDEILPPDGANFFYDNLPQPTYLQVWENDDHNLDDNHLDEIDHNIEAFFLNVYRNLSFPQFSWTRHEDETSGTIIVTTSTPPLTITSWWADTTNITCEPEMNNTCRRDFRITTLEGESGIWWYEEPVQEIDINTYGATFLKRDDFGYRIFFIELTFPGPDDYTFRFTTSVQIIPDTYPYAKCETEEECKGRIV